MAEADDDDMTIVMPLFRSSDWQTHREPSLRCDHAPLRRSPKDESYEFHKEFTTSLWVNTKQQLDGNQQHQIHTTQQLRYGWNLEQMKLKKLSPFHQILSKQSVLRIPKDGNSLQAIVDAIYEVLHHYSIQATFVDAPAALAQCQALPSTYIDRPNVPLEFNIHIWDDKLLYLIELSYVSGDTFAFELLCKNDMVTMLASRLIPSSRRGNCSIDGNLGKEYGYRSDDTNCSMDVDEVDSAGQRYAAVQSLVTQVVASAIHSSLLLERSNPDWWMTPQIPEISAALDMIEASYSKGTSSMNDQSVHAYHQPSYDLLMRNLGLLMQMLDPNYSGYESAQMTSRNIFFPNSESEASYPHIRQVIVSSIVKEESQHDDQHVIAAMSIAVRCLSLWNSEEVASFVSLLSTACGHTETNLSFNIVDYLMQRWILSKPCLSANATITTLTLHMLSIMMNRHLDIKQYIYDRYSTLIQQIYEYGSIHHIQLQGITSHMLSQCNVVAVI